MAIDLDGTLNNYNKTIDADIKDMLEYPVVYVYADRKGKVTARELKKNE